MPTLLGHLMASCSTLREALESYVRYQEIELHSWRLSVREGSGEDEILFIPLSPLSRDRLILDFVLSSTLGTVKRLTGRDLSARSAQFSYAEPADSGAHRSLLACPLEFGAPETALVVAKEELDAPVRTANYEVRELLETALRKTLRQQIEERYYTVKVLEAVTKRRGGVAPDERSIAQDLGVGIRVLQLKLQQEGTSFRKLSDAGRAEMAQEYLEDTALGIKEIAYLLGFSDSRAFHRAFLR